MNNNAANFVDLPEDTVAFVDTNVGAAGGIVVDNMLVCGGLLLQLDHGYAAAHLTWSDPQHHQDFVDRLVAAGGCLQHEIIRPGLTGYNPVRRAYLYCPLEYWGPFLQSNEGRDAMHRLRDYINYDITVLNKPTTPVDVRVRAPDPGSDRWAAKRDTGGGQHQLPHHPMAGAPHWADGEYKFFQLRGKSWRTPPPNTVGIDMILRRDAINANVWQDMDM